MKHIAWRNGIKPIVWVLAGFLLLSTLSRAIAQYCYVADGSRPLSLTQPWPQKVKAKVNGHPLVLEVAQTPQEIEHGLMGRHQLAAHQGMVFHFGNVQIRHFWMKDTPIPLDMVFLAPMQPASLPLTKHSIQPYIFPQPNGTLTNSPLKARVTQIVHGAMPCTDYTQHQPCPIYSTTQAVAWVVELAGGQARRLGIAPGSTVMFYP